MTDLPDNLPPNLCLYRQALGESFDCLPSVLRQFHAQPFGAKAQGTLCVTRGTGQLRNIVATLMRLPAPGEDVPVRLEVQAKDGREHWIRYFGSLCLTTDQWMHDGLLIESAGPLRFGFRMTCDAKGMRFTFARCWFLALPLPAALSPRVDAEVQEREDGWWLEVRVTVPLLGLLTRYEGEVKPI